MNYCISNNVNIAPNNDLQIASKVYVHFIERYFGGKRFSAKLGIRTLNATNKYTEMQVVSVGLGVLYECNRLVPFKK